MHSDRQRRDVAILLTPHREGPCAPLPSASDPPTHPPSGPSESFENPKRLWLRVTINTFTVKNNDGVDAGRAGVPRRLGRAGLASRLRARSIAPRAPARRGRTAPPPPVLASRRSPCAALSAAPACPAPAHYYPQRSIHGMALNFICLPELYEIHHSVNYTLIFLTREDEFFSLKVQ
ncbi:hypothetical protein EVAR_75832_1 [Eumeta japonica]|uniref:Uncharacterized protein n=1 Tax=Eumeta variegata TaxID=151549 RepID=A0A4C1TG47_EUMVA|nr:hypothetical protein EVAR_75832_1 [Eumeta japonica]